MPAASKNGLVKVWPMAPTPGQKGHMLGSKKKKVVMDNKRSESSNENAENKERQPFEHLREGVHSPAADEAASQGMQESEFGRRSFGYPDFLEKKKDSV